MAEELNLRDVENIQREADCSICLNKCSERLLPNCGHSFCEECLHKINENGKISCPECRKVSTLPDGKVQNLMRNFVAMRIRDQTTSIIEEKGRATGESAKMKLVVNLLNGKKMEVQVNGPDVTVNELKREIAEKSNIGEDHQRLLYLGKELENEKKLGHYKIVPYSTIHMVQRMLGGRLILFNILSYG